MGYAIAIDGPSGAGKSTIAKELAKKLGFVYVDTGALYRAYGILYRKKGLSFDCPKALEKSILNSKVSLTYDHGQQQVWIDGENVTNQLRQEEVGMLASKLAALPVVRESLLDVQRQVAKEHCVIMDGRDIGTMVLPDANLKIFLTASVEVRAKRRYKELIDRGEKACLEKVEQDIMARDEQDKNRAISPLKKAKDAILVDASSMTIQEVVESIYEKIKEVDHESY